MLPISEAGCESHNPEVEREVYSSVKTNIKMIACVGLFSVMMLGSPQISNAETSTEVLDYEEFIQDKEKLLYTKEPLNVSLDQVADTKQLVNNQLHLENQGSVTLNVHVEEAGIYFPQLKYNIQNESVLPTQIQLTVNDQTQYRQLDNLIFRSNWQRSSEVALDRYGNEVVGEISKDTAFVTSYLYESEGFLDMPLGIELKAGDNEITFHSVEGELFLQEVSLYPEKDISELNIAKDSQAEATGSNRLTIQAEFPIEQNASSIRPGAAYDSSLTPYDSKKRVLNYLDSASFYTAGDEVVYEVDVPDTGDYYLTMHYRQDKRIDFPVFMNIKVDGEIPSESYLRQPIPYSTKFDNHTVQNTDGQSVAVHLEKGKHEISFAITGQPIGDSFYRVSDIISEVQELSLQVKDLLGGTIDRNRDVDLDDYMPDTKKNLLVWADELKDIGNQVTKLAGAKELPGAYSQVGIAERQLRDLAEDYRHFANRYDELTSVVTTNLSTLLQEVINMGTSIDEITLHQGESVNEKSGNIFQTIGNSVTRFLGSFSNADYQVNTESKNLQVWVNRPRQYVEIMQKMVDQQFTAKTGINVDISIMPDQNKLILANASGTSPDVALGVSYGLPFDMGIRNALEDLSQYEGFDDIQETMAPNLFIPATIGDSVYSIPETMNFYVMFYRKDILDSLGMAVPDTLEDLVNLLPALQQQGMSAFYPTAISGYKAFPLTMPVVYQSGGDFYTDDILKTGISTDQTIAGMRDLTDLFTIYNMPKEVPSFYQQFRDGTIPIGVSDYNAYNLILNAAPEIANLWDIAMIPGVANEDGEVVRYSSAGAETSIMFKSSEMKDESWDFMQWWHSTEVQADFGIELQTSNGKEYIWNTANLEAFAQLPWSTKHKEVILDQAKWITEVPRTVSSYMLEREISAIYNGVVIDGKNLRRLTDNSAKIINRETIRKLEEFGYYEDGEMVTPYPTLPEVGGDSTETQK